VYPVADPYEDVPVLVDAPASRFLVIHGVKVRWSG
jgi:hypothetical protein